MKDLKKPIQPFYLPQMNNISYKFVSDNLTEMGVAHEPIMVGVSQIKPTQKDVDMEKIKSLSEVDDRDLTPVWISRDANLLDGHHRVASKIFKEGKNSKIKAIRIDADQMDGAAYLKIIQDRWERRHK